ncbi:MAG: hypothetical protein ACRDWE_05465 [Acidimicrobiales bacterium]
MTAPGAAIGVPVRGEDFPAPPLPSLHLPDEPLEQRLAWRLAALEGTPLATVVSGRSGVAGWLYTRWRALGAAGIAEEDFASIVFDYRRELWLWLAGERTWAHCCSGLIGRVVRRRPTPGTGAKF